MVLVSFLWKLFRFFFFFLRLRFGKGGLSGILSFSVISKFECCFWIKKKETRPLGNFKISTVKDFYFFLVYFIIKYSILSYD